MYVTIVEDDYYQAEMIEEDCRKEFGNIRFLRVKTEHDFRTAIDEFRKDPPDVFIIDVMLRYTDPKRDQPVPPPSVRREGSHRAGLRCRKLLAEHATTRDIPVILYTVLEKTDLAKELERLPANVLHLRKDADRSELLDTVQRVRRRS